VAKPVSLGRELTRLGAHVRVLRHQAGLTQDQLAELVGRSRGTIANIERGAQDPPYTLLVTLAGALGVSPRRLVE
jgi:putative transcriptional regulator